ncbi:hypothetical protein GUJ93_ZPchr0013g36118 [Zizania palustris]|uniref:Uncharacterized protein n=1 Tax=Zizania palustris TaxID=103762 RepID=A0A8J5WYH5_ZIZPA|nr:hypothetical protein GUJ93_ZPchr0013g36118 [Zizania palustris]
MERRRPGGDDVEREGRKRKRATKEDDTKKKMAAAMRDSMLWHKVAAVSGVAALGLGTYGAHMFHPEDPAYKEVWHTASLYHLVHTAALLGAPVTKRPNVVSILAIRTAVHLLSDFHGFFVPCHLRSSEGF